MPGSRSFSEHCFPVDASVFSRSPDPDRAPRRLSPPLPSLEALLPHPRTLRFSAPLPVAPIQAAPFRVTRFPGGKIPTHISRLPNPPPPPGSPPILLSKPHPFLPPSISWVPPFRSWIQLPLRHYQLLVRTPRFSKRLCPFRPKQLPRCPPHSPQTPIGNWAAATTAYSNVWSGHIQPPGMVWPMGDSKARRSTRAGRNLIRCFMFHVKHRRHQELWFHVKQNSRLEPPKIARTRR